MSMATLTILQLTGIFCAYLFITVGIPAFVFGRKLRGHSAAERFLLYFMTGNFYIMNLVFVLQLLKISYPITLILGMLIPAVVIRLVINKTPVRKITEDYIKYFRRLVGGQLGFKTASYHIFKSLGRQLARFWKWVGHFVIFRFFDCVLVAFLLLVLWWVYGHNLLSQYGYKASDLLVHNYWINALNDNNIFVAGVYPHGFHVLLYYLHAVFGIETFVLLRVFAFVQNVMLHLMLLLVLRLCCKSRYAAYAGTILFVISNYFRAHTYSRYYATLPQEFGIIFIFPAVYFLFAFFVARRQELKENPPEKKKKRRRIFSRKKKVEPEAAAITLDETPNTQPESEVQPSEEKKGLRRWLRRLRKKIRKKRQYPYSWVCLAGFCMSFSMTLAVHFYGTMIAGIFCIAIAIGYFFWIIRKNYFWSVMKAGLLSVAIAVLPMLLAFLGGTPLQGSLGWGMTIIMGDKNNTSEEESKEEEFTGAIYTVIELDELGIPSSVLQDGPYTFVYEGQQVTLYPYDGNDNIAYAIFWGENYEGQEDTIYPNNNIGNIGNGDNIDNIDNINNINNINNKNNVDNTADSTSFEEKKLSFEERLQQFLSRLEGFGKRVWKDFSEALSTNVLSLPENIEIEYVLYSFLALIGLGMFYLLFRQFSYGAMLISTGLYMFFLCFMMTAGEFGLPALMDSNRGSIYLSYSFPLAVTLLLDGVLYLPFFPWRNKVAKVTSHILNLLSLACVCFAVYYVVDNGQIREPRDPAGQEMNETVVCLTNIINTEKDFTWTIVSANDELRMGEDHGYHYETIVFLEEMEELEEDTMIRIPTPIVFFYIEKVPVDYNVPYENSGQSVSEEGAARILPANSGIGMYQGERRWVLMSRMYYWAEEFKKKYPDELEVYMETDDFVCYRLKQNPYRLYNFAIDYGYNNRYFR